MSVDLYIGALQGAKNGNEMLEILDLISSTEQEDDSWYTDPNSKASYHHYWYLRGVKFLTQTVTEGGYISSLFCIYCYTKCIKIN